MVSFFNLILDFMFLWIILASIAITELQEQAG